MCDFRTTERLRCEGYQVLFWLRSEGPGKSSSQARKQRRTECRIEPCWKFRKYFRCTQSNHTTHWSWKEGARPLQPDEYSVIFRDLCADYCHGM